MNRIKTRSPSGKKKRKTNFKNNKKKIRRSHGLSSASVQCALQALVTGVSYRKASKEYSILVGVLHRLKKNEGLEVKKGPPTLLTSEEELEIVNWILHRAATGIPATADELKDSVEDYVKAINRDNPFKNDRPGRHWFEGFKKRHPNIIYRTAQSLELVRANVTEEDLREWFDEIHTFLESKGLLNFPPSRVFNCDETSLQLIPKPTQVLAEKGASTAYQTTDGNDKENHSVLFTYIADDTRAPP